MNEIILRTNSCEYNAGDTLFGAVYLQIHTPTIGCGVRLKFYGYETLQSYSADDGTSPSLIKQFNDIVHNDGLVLHKEDGPLGYGCYVLPFRYELPVGLPGSFFYKHPKEHWKATITYELHAEVMEANTIHTMEPITMIDSSSGFKGSTIVQHLLKMCMGFVKRDIRITACICEDLLRCGETCRVKVSIINGPGVIIQAIDLKLRQTMSRAKTETIDIEGRLGYIANSEIIRKVHIQSDLLRLGCYEILLPLTSETGLILPSTKGTLFQCTYIIHASVTFKNGDIVYLDVPIEKLLPAIKTSTWTKWQSPPWISSANIIPSDTPFTVPDCLLVGEAFSNVPLPRK